MSLSIQQITQFINTHQFSDLIEACKQQNQYIRSYDKVKWHNHIYEVGQTMLVEGALHICRLLQVHNIMFESYSCPFVEVQYFLRKRDLPPRVLNNFRDVFSDNEVFLTKKKGVLFLDSVIQPCRVYNYEEYEHNRNNQDVYFTRSEFHEGVFDPPIENWEKLCLCQKPLNPDVPYIQCDFCEKWYHLKCMNISQEEADSLKRFACLLCKQKY